MLTAGQAAHGLLVDYDVFKNVRPPDQRQPHKIYEIGDMDFSLKPNSVAVDAGCRWSNLRWPNLNDDFAGKAADLGALEAGKPQPVYGPRSRAGQ